MAQSVNNGWRGAKSHHLHCTVNLPCRHVVIMNELYRDWSHQILIGKYRLSPGPALSSILSVIREASCDSSERRFTASR